MLIEKGAVFDWIGGLAVVLEVGGGGGIVMLLVEHG